MPFRKCPGLLSSFSGFNNVSCLYPQIYTSSPSAISQQRPRSTSAPSERRLSQQRRYYADLRNERIRPKAHIPLWPDMTSATAVPTPYQIFDQAKGAPYSKHRFYELVKLYHPDRHGHDALLPGDCSQATKLERYRLVVAANNILADPVKRDAYDRWGAGWAGLPEVGDRTRSWSSAAGAGWSGFNDNSPSQNATWEDWERWYQRDTKGRPQEPQFISNLAFISLIATLAALGGIGQATRVGNYSMKFSERRDRVHDSAAQELTRAKEESAAFENRNGRIQRFLSIRDPIGCGLIDPDEESYRRLLPAPQVCSSGNIKDRRMNLYHNDEDERP